MKLKQSRKRIRKKTKRINYKIKQSMKRNKVKKTRQNYKFKRNRSRTMKRGGAAAAGSGSGLAATSGLAGSGSGLAATSGLAGSGAALASVSGSGLAGSEEEEGGAAEVDTNLKLTCKITTGEKGKKQAECKET